MENIIRNRQYYKFCGYGFLKNLKFFEAFILLFLIDKGFSFTAIGVLYAIRELSANILEIPSGIAADVFGRKKTLAASLLAYILSFLALLLCRNFYFFVAGFFLYGVGEAFRSGTHKGMIADYLKSRDIKDQMINYYGHTRSWSQRGLAISSITAGIIVFFSGNYSNIFLYSIIPYLMNFVLILSYPKELDRSPGKSGEKISTQIKDVVKTSISTLKNWDILKLLNTTALHTAYLKAMKDYIQPMMVSMVLVIPLFPNRDDVQKSAIFIGIIYFVIFLSTSYASRRSGFLAGSGIKNIPYITLLTGLGTGVLSGLFYSLGVPFAAVLFFVVIYIIENLRKPILTGYISNKVDNSILTSVLSVQSQMKTILTALIALIFGIAADIFGIGYALIIVSASLMIISLILKD